MAVEVYLAYLATIAVFFASPPGPSQLLMIANSARHGVRASSATVAGDLSANALQMTAAAFGLVAIIAASESALTVVKWVGVCYLAYMGVRTFMRASAPKPSVSTGMANRLYWQGFLTSATNPKAVFFFAALFPQFVDPGAPIWPQLAILGLTYLVVDGTLLFIYGSVAEKLAATLVRRSSLVNRICGCLMVLAAVLLAFRDTDVRASTAAARS